MPQIIVTAGGAKDREQDAVMLRERVNVSDFESEHFATQLVQRLGWAVGDAHQVEQDGRAQRRRSAGEPG
jgi:hypothetical protein